MSEIVVAYAQPDASAADRVIKKLEEFGFQVRRDEAGDKSTARRTPSVRGRNSAEPTLVLWSRHYALARLRGKARSRSATLAARLDTAPLSFLMKSPSIDLRAWRGRDDHRGWKTLLANARSAAGAPGKVTAKRSSAAPASKPAAVKASPVEKPAKKGGMGGVLALLAALVAIGGAAATYFLVLH